MRRRIPEMFKLWYTCTHKNKANKFNFRFRFFLSNRIWQYKEMFSVEIIYITFVLKLICWRFLQIENSSNWKTQCNFCLKNCDINKFEFYRSKIVWILLIAFHCTKNDDDTKHQFSTVAFIEHSLTGKKSKHSNKQKR